MLCHRSLRLQRTCGCELHKTLCCGHHWGRPIVKQWTSFETMTQFSILPAQFLHHPKVTIFNIELHIVPVIDSYTSMALRYVVEP